MLLENCHIIFVDFHECCLKIVTLLLSFFTNVALQAARVMLQAYDSMARDGGDDVADDDRVAVMVFVSDEKGKGGAVQEQV